MYFSSLVMNEICEIAIEAAKKASRITQRIFHSHKKSILKKDQSPVTIADYASQIIIMSHIKRFSKDMIIGEEDAEELDQVIVETIHSLLLSEFPDDQFLSTDLVNPQNIVDILKQSKHPKDSSPSQFWTIDPIDGTKGFLRGDQYAIAISWVKDGVTRIGVLACPNLSYPEIKISSSIGTLAYAIRGQGAFQIPLNGGNLLPMSTHNSNDLVLCESVETSHSDHHLSQKLMETLGVTQPSLRIDSQCKYVCVARGDASIYFRLARENYIEKIWDHSAGSIIAEESGGTVTDIYGKPLDFNCGAFLSNNKGILAYPSNLRKVQETVDLILP